MLNAINPYIAGSPVTGPEMFFGREDIFTFIRQALIGKHRDNIIVLYGQRRTGKTSTLYQLPSHLGPHHLCVFIDLQALHLEGIDGFLWELANHIQRVLQREHQIELPPLERQEFMVDARNFFQYKFLDQIWSAIGDRHLLLMLDEATRLEEQVRTGKLEPQIFEYMSHLMQHYERLNFLFSLGRGLEEMEKEYSLLFRTAVYKKISFLDRDTTNALITNPVKDYYEVEDAAQERVFQITSGHPYCIQLLCHNLFNCWQQHPVEIVTVQDVEKGLDEAVERGLAVFKHTWEESTAAEKAVMAAISEITGDTSAPVSTDSINQAWKSYKVRIPRGEMAQALKNLIARDVIKGTDTYVFCVDLQRLWIQKYRRFDWVAEEITEKMDIWATVEKKRVGRLVTTLTTFPKIGGIRTLFLIGLILILTIGGEIAYSNYQQARVALTYPFSNTFRTQITTQTATPSFNSVSIKVGDTATIPDWTWVTLVNKNSVTQIYSNDTEELKAGDTCGVEFGGVDTVEQIQGSNLLVKYTAPGNPIGTPCPTGVEYILSKTVFSTMTQQYIAKANAITDEKDLVKQLLAQNYHGQITDAGDWHWVTVVNLQPVVQHYTNSDELLSFGDTCGAGRSTDGVQGGTIQVRGKADGTVLYEYTAYGNPYGTPCPSGVLYFG